MKLTTIFIGLSSVLNLSAQSPNFNKEVCLENKSFCEYICTLRGGPKTNICSVTDLSFECTCNDSSDFSAMYNEFFPANVQIYLDELDNCYQNCVDNDSNCYFVCVNNINYAYEEGDNNDPIQAINSDASVNSPKLVKDGVAQSRQQIFHE